MMTSIDGRIDCDMTSKLPGVKYYYPLLEELDLPTTITGKVTAELEIAEPGKFIAKQNVPVLREIISKKVDNTAGYEVIVDTKGTLLCKNDDQYDQPHIIVTSMQVSQDYLDYLDEKNISYIVTGNTMIDLARAVEILHQTFGVERLGVVGGASINTSFLDAGLLDEVVLLVGAGIDGRASFPPLFNRKEESKDQPTILSLVSVKVYDSGAVMIRYKAKENAK